jgi:large repetitive protein
VGRRAAVLFLAAGALLLTPGAPGGPDVPGDPTPPVVLPIITGTLGLNGWYTTNVTLSWNVTDPESIILSTSGCDTVTFTADTPLVTRTCSATSDGGTTTIDKPFHIDKTPPLTDAAASRAPNGNGWYKDPVDVSFSGSDGTSGLDSCDAPKTYGGPDNGNVSVSGTCRDKAGNTGTASLSVKYDSTKPQTSPSARGTDKNGWYNHSVTVNYQGSDATSGVDNCTQTTYAGPDDPSIALGGTCTDKAGNVSGSSVFTMKYDETAPQASATASRGPDVNAWYNHDLSVSFSGSDATSGLDVCDPPKTYSGPDSANAVVSGTCLDVAGNTITRSLALKYDETAPQATATPDRQPNAKGWYRVAVTVGFSGTDATSGLASCAAPKSYSGPDDPTASVSGTCLDQAGNTGGTSFALKYDATAPQTSAAPSRQPNANGWYNAQLSVSFAGTDGTAGIDSCDASKSYSGPDTPSTAVSGACRDNAGNSANGSFTLKYDATDPTITAAAARQPNANGWFNASVAVNFTGGDATSGVDSCDAPKTYAGPDSATASVAGNCTDKAGNTGTSSLSLKYDATVPVTTAGQSPQPNANGWNKSTVTVSYTGSDATAGIESCDAAKTYSGPDTQSTTLTGACRDKAGNSSSAFRTLKYDATPPAATATPDRQPNANNWFNAPLTVSFGATDAMSGPNGCDLSKTYSGPDNASASVSGTCLDKAGNTASASYGLKYDATAPQATATPSRVADKNGWYNHALTVSFAATDATSGLQSCPADSSYPGPDTTNTSVNGTCFDKAGNGGLASVTLKYDATAPSTSATADRAPNANGWYRASVTVTFAGTDGTAGIDSCDAAKTYAGPDTQSTTLGGDCRDKAGNASSASRTLKYDATAPVTTATPSAQPNANGWYKASLTVTFAGTDAMSGMDPCDPAKTYSGPDSATASLTGTCPDKAGNVGATSYALKYDATAPVTTATPDRQPNAGGWYRAPAVAVTFTATDAMSSVDSCDPVKSYSGPDSATASVSGACKDKAGNSDTDSVALKYDATAPLTTAAASPQPNANGWNNSTVTVTFTGSDATAGIETCDPAKSYSGPDTQSTTLSGACRDKAGNSDSDARSVEYDATAPQTTPAPSRQPNANGWYRAPLTVSFSATDTTSGTDGCELPKGYSGPDSATASVAGTCLDRAGNTGSASYGLKYDATAPQATATPSRQPNAKGWFNASLNASFTAADALSGFDSCPAPQTYGGPDSVAAVVSGTCLDKAGNGGLASYGLKYDATAPQTAATPDPSPNASGWNKSPVTLTFAGNDATAGIDSCSAPQSYAGPDVNSKTLSGSCIDNAGNGSGASRTLKYDATPPNLTDAVPRRAPDRAGWYNHPVEVDAVGKDDMSGLAAPCTSAVYSGPDGDNVPISGQCVDVAGNVGFKWFSIDYDATAPQAAAAARRGPDVNGWYNHAVTVEFAGSDSVSGLESCAPPEDYSGPDSGLAVVGGICLDKAGNAGVGSYALQFDATPPQVTGASPTRQPDSNGWYNQPLDVRFQGADATSAIESCTQALYAGPDAGATSVSGFCRDRAGNRSSDSSFALKYDATPPAVTGVTAKAGDRRAVLSWTASPDTTSVEIHRAGTLVYRGHDEAFTDTGLKNGVRYRYTLTGYDEAHNAATSTTAATPTAPLVSPLAGAVVKAPPRLAWIRVAKSTYYNVQVWRNGRIFSSWPKGTSIKLKRSWIYNGRRYRLTPGKYRWYVWPGYGARTAKKFGRLLGSSSFIVRAR